MILHEGTTFLVTDEAGQIPCGSERGLFFQDVRVLSRHELFIDGAHPLFLSEKKTFDNESYSFLTNPQLEGALMGTLGVIRRLRLRSTLHEDIDIENYGDDDASLVLTIASFADFSHIFAVRQAMIQDEKTCALDELERHVAQDGRFERLVPKGGQYGREVLRAFSAPADFDGDEATFRIRIPRHGRYHLCIDIYFGDPAVAPCVEAICTSHRNHRREAEKRRRHKLLCEASAGIETDHELIERAYRRASDDIASLRIKAEETLPGEAVLAAGIPWYMALFGRDSLIASIQTLLFDPAIARGTLRVLAARQGKKADPISGEEPGKILHEDRLEQPPEGSPIPAFPYYGSVDATPLFLITLSEYARTTGDLELCRELWPAAMAALAWIERYGDRDGDGLLEYQRTETVGLENQGWKDSVDAVRFLDGTIAEPPIALCEVQGYAADAFARMAELSSALGEPEQGSALSKRAARLRERISESFWMPERGYFAEALDGKKRRVDSLTSNPGHLLWSGVVSEEEARRIAEVLISEEMFSGYGIRTMGKGEGGYNPISYHNGSVWPHDNSLIVAGLLRYGLVREAQRVMSGLIEALRAYKDDRLPELFSGYASRRYHVPVEYPSANRPQAWASGAVIYLVQSIVGLSVNALSRTLSAHPVVIPGMSRLRLSRVPIAGGFSEVRMEVSGEEARVSVEPLPEGFRWASWQEAA